MTTRKPILAKKRMKPIGKQGRKYQEFRNTVAYPYLVATFGEKCAICKQPGKNLDVDHIQKRGSHPELKYELSNLQLLCRRCHNIKDNQ
jgi:5-methylcytosine-specific restriction endonuclease McrA